MSAQHPYSYRESDPGKWVVCGPHPTFADGMQLRFSSKLDAADVAAALNSAFQCGVVCGGDQEAKP